MDFKVGVFDSGIGGLSILSELEKVLPNEDFYYYGDSLNNPYGEKSDEELFKITSEVVDYLINKGCKLIVIACNTATTRCMKYLREKYQDITFVGTVPAIKVACDREFKNTFSEYKDKNIDSIVLGCTHYPFIKEEILKEMPNVILIDGARGVSLEVKRQLENKEHLSEKRDRKIVIYNSLTKEEVIK